MTNKQKSNKLNLIGKVFRYFWGYDIFISYSRRDCSIYALALANKLILQGMSCYLDQFSALPGEKLPKGLKRSLRHSKVMVLLVTEGVLESQAVSEEIDICLGLDKKILPIDFGFIKKADWFSKISGAHISLENKQMLTKASPSKDILTVITQSFKYKKQASRIKTAIIGAISLFVILLSVLIGISLNAQKKITKSQATLNDLEKKITESQTKINDQENKLKNSRIDFEKEKRQKEKAIKRAEEESEGKLLALEQKTLSTLEKQYSLSFNNFKNTFVLLDQIKENTVSTTSSIQKNINNGFDAAIIKQDTITSEKFLFYEVNFDKKYKKSPYLVKHVEKLCEISNQRFKILNEIRAINSNHKNELSILHLKLSKKQYRLSLKENHRKCLTFLDQIISHPKCSLDTIKLYLLNGFHNSIKRENRYVARKILLRVASMDQSHNNISNLTDYLKSYCRRFHGYRFSLMRNIKDLNQNHDLGIKKVYFEQLFKDMSRFPKNEELLILGSILWQEKKYKEKIISGLKEDKFSLPYWKETRPKLDTIFSKDLIFLTSSIDGDKLFSIDNFHLYIYDAFGNIIDKKERIDILQHSNFDNKRNTRKFQYIPSRNNKNVLLIITLPQEAINKRSFHFLNAVKRSVKAYNIVSGKSFNTNEYVYPIKPHNAITSFAKETYEGRKIGLDKTLFNMTDDFLHDSSHKKIARLNDWYHIEKQVSRFDYFKSYDMNEFRDLKIIDNSIYTGINPNNNYIIHGTKLWNPNLDELFNLNHWKKEYPELIAFYKLN